MKKERPRISVYIALSIDRYIARKDDSLDWLDRVGGFDEDYGFKQMLAGIDALIIGRKKYEIASTVPDDFESVPQVISEKYLWCQEKYTYPTTLLVLELNNCKKA
jgi:dihydrofolate reductase